MMTSPTLKSDIIIAIRQPHLDHIVSLKKNHEFRSYLLPACVKRFWIYEPSPVSAIKYIAQVSNGKHPGEVSDENFIRNADFNLGKIENGRFAYEILKLEELESPVTLAELKSKNWLGGAPQKYCYLKKSMAYGVRDAKTIAISAHSSSILSNVSIEWQQEEGKIESTNLSSSHSKRPKTTKKQQTTLLGGIQKEGEKIDAGQERKGALIKWLDGEPELPLAPEAF